MSASDPVRPSNVNWSFCMPALALVVLAAVFCRASQLPLDHQNTWGFWKYGEWVWQHKRLPAQEPFSPYSDKQSPLLDSAWLSETAGYLVYARFGLEGIALVYALLETALAALCMVACRRATGSWCWALAGTSIIWIERWSSVATPGPQLFGQVCWMALLAMCVRAPSRFTVIAVPLLIALWANLHGSFLIGPAFLAVILIGRLVERAWTLRSIPAAMEDAELRRTILLLLFSIVAACVNPYGPKLLSESIRLYDHPLVSRLRDWQPLLPLTTFAGRALAVSLLIVLVTLRLSPRTFTLTEALLLLSFGTAAWFVAYMVPWWLMLWPIVLLPHWQAFLAGVMRRADGAARIVSSVPVTGAAIALAALLLLLSPSGRWLLFGQARPAQTRVSADTPFALTERLNDWAKQKAETGHGLPLRVYNSLDWGEYLLWQMPPDARVYWYNRLQQYDVQSIDDGQHFYRLLDPPYDWRQVMEKRRFNAVVLAAEPPSPLFDYLEKEARPPEWEIIYNDAAAVRTGDDPRGKGIIAVRRIDPFVLTLANAEAAQGCVGSVGMTPFAGNWSILTHLPWSWKE